MKKKMLSVFMALCMILTLLPTTALAANGEKPATLPAVEEPVEETPAEAATPAEGELEEITVGQDGLSLADAFAKANGSDAETVKVVIPAGTFSPIANDQLKITRDNVTIEGAGVDKTTIDCGAYSCSGNGAILISGNNVTLKDLTVTSTDAVKSAAAIKITDIENGDLQDGCCLENLSVSSTTSNAIDLNGVTNCIVKNVTITGAAKCGIALSTADVTVSGLATPKCGWGDIGMMENGTGSSLTLAGENNFGGGLIYAEGKDGHQDIVTLESEQNVAIVGTQIEGDEKLTLPENSGLIKFEVNGNAFYAKNLADVIEAVGEGDTITLTCDIPNATGISVPSGKDFTIDFGGYTYTLVGPGAGSAGTETNGFQLLRDSNITMKNGTIKVQDNASNIKLVIQNYANLTLDSVELIGGKNTNCIISSNYGDTTLKNVDISGTYPGPLIALDLMHWLGGGYADKAPTMTIQNAVENKISGSVDVYCYGPGANTCPDKPKMTIYGGTFTANVKNFVAPGMTQDETGKIVVDKETAAAKVNGIGYPTVQKAIDAANAGDTVTVFAGEHKEALIIQKNLTLQGEDGAVITFDADTTFNAQDAIAGETTGYAGIITVKDADVTLKNITIQGNSEAASQNQTLTHTHRYAGIVALSSNVTVDDCKILDITYEDHLVGMQNGFGIYAVTGNESNKLTVTKTAIENFNKAAMVVRTNIELVVDGCTITGKGEQALISQNGIQYAGNATITNTTISDLKYTAENEWKGGSVAIYNVGEDTTSTIDNVTCTNVDYSLSTTSGSTEVKGGHYDGKIAGKNDSLIISGGEFEDLTDEDLSDFRKSEISTDIGEKDFVVGIPVEFTFSTVANRDEGKYVKGTSTFSNEDAIEKLEYYEVKDGKWHEFSGDFGPSTGFPMDDATSNFRVTFKKAGNYTFTASMKTADADDEEILCSTEVTINVRNASSGGSSSGDYMVSVDKTTGGRVTVSPSRADKGDTVTITVKPNEGYQLDELTVTDKDGDSIKLTEKADNKFTFTMPGSKVTVEATFVKAGEESVLPFRDVDVDDWFYDAVVYAYENDLMSGTSATTFAPDSQMTRAMIWTVLAANDGVNTSGGAVWYEQGQKWAMENGVSDGSDPNGSITREQLAMMLWRCAGSPKAEKSLDNYTDASSVSQWAVEAMAWAVENGLISGMGDGVLAPQGNATRAQVATIMMNFCETVAK